MIHLTSVKSCLLSKKKWYNRECPTPSSHSLVPPAFFLCLQAQDYAYIRKKIDSGELPFVDVLEMYELERGKEMGIGSMLAAQQRFRSGRWDAYKYIYYTESDQVLYMRHPAAIFEEIEGTSLVPFATE